jgi:hypothetical protein
MILVFHASPMLSPRVESLCAILSFPLFDELPIAPRAVFHLSSQPVLFLSPFWEGAVHLVMGYRGCMCYSCFMYFPFDSAS